MLFKSFIGWQTVNKRGKKTLVAHFSPAAGRKNPRGEYEETGLRHMLKNPPPAFKPSDRELVERALKEAPAHRR